jgi:hypothetical protein
MAKETSLVDAIKAMRGNDHPTGSPPVVTTNPDPTLNVRELTASAVAGESALREMSTRYQDKISDLRDTHYREMRKAESDRIDAIRLVDTGSVSRAAEVATDQATALATAVAQSAEALRLQVEATRVATRSELETALHPIQATLESLRQTQFQQQGEKTARVEGTGDDRFIQVFQQTQEQFTAVLRQQQNAAAQQQENFLETIKLNRTSAAVSNAGVKIAGIVGGSSVIIAIATLVVLILAHVL